MRWKMSVIKMYLLFHLEGEGTEISSAEFSDPNNSNFQTDFQLNGLEQKISSVWPTSLNIHNFWSKSVIKNLFGGLNSRDLKTL